MMPKCGVLVVALALVACGGRAVTDGLAAQGGQSSGGSSSVAGASGGGGSAECLSAGLVPPTSHVLFVFESDQPLWMRRTCDMDYTLSKVCGDTSASIQTTTDCIPACGSKDSGCAECAPCWNPPVLLGPPSADGTTATMVWLGDVYTPGTTRTGCACSNATRARTGTYTIGVNGFLTADDALANRNGYPFSSTFEYPPPNGEVHVKLNFTGL